MSLYSLPCLQEVDGITVLWGVRGAAGLFPCEGMTEGMLKSQRKQTIISGGCRIFQRVGVLSYYLHNFCGNCMKMKKNWIERDNILDYICRPQTKFGAR